MILHAELGSDTLPRLLSFLSLEKQVLCVIEAGNFPATAIGRMFLTSVISANQTVRAVSVVRKVLSRLELVFKPIEKFVTSTSELMSINEVTKGSLLLEPQSPSEKSKEEMLSIKALTDQE